MEDSTYGAHTGQGFMYTTQKKKITHTHAHTPIHSPARPYITCFNMANYKALSVFGGIEKRLCCPHTSENARVGES